MANTYSKNTAKIDSAQKQIMNVVNVDKKKKNLHVAYEIKLLN